MKFNKLFHAMVLVRPDGIEETKQRGIVIPAVAQSERQTQPTGVVVMAGPGTEEVPVSVEKGDRVLYGQAITLTVEGSDHHLVDMRAIMGTVDDR